MRWYRYPVVYEQISWKTWTELDLEQKILVSGPNNLTLPNIVHDGYKQKKVKCWSNARIADPERLSRIQIFSRIPDWQDPGSRLWIFFHPGSRRQRSTGSWIRNTVKCFKHFLIKMIQYYFRCTVYMVKNKWCLDVPPWDQTQSHHRQDPVPEAGEADTTCARLENN